MDQLSSFFLIAELSQTKEDEMTVEIPGQTGPIKKAYLESHDAYFTQYTISGITRTRLSFGVCGMPALILHGEIPFETKVLEALIEAYFVGVRDGKSEITGLW
ncbi:hypothetical protein L6172_14985 [Thalassospiraceae bacterium SW-3-3]|nr:hypothetical protein L6172_14985 [Thalassospiraceae bacterium SW-3-3]